MKKLFIILIAVVFLLSAIPGAGPVSAATALEKFNASLNDTADPAGYDTEEGDSLEAKIGQAIKLVLSMIGVIFLVLMIYGGYIWMMARGNESETQKAKTIIQNSLIGLIIIIAAYAITSYIMDFTIYAA